METSTLSSIVRVLTNAFKEHNVAFEASDEQSDGVHEKSYRSVGIVEGEALPYGHIKIRLSNEVVFVLTDDEQFNEFIRRLTAVIRHELVHREQDVRSKHNFHSEHAKRSVQKLEEWAQYYLDLHEQEAMAHEMIENWTQYKLTADQILKQLQYSYSDTLARFSMRYEEIHHFAMKNHRCVIMKRLRKLIYQVLSN